ncbi:MAG: hypothetical protein QXL94_00920 [Candidatus Parvarchaeum sp.]
MRENKFKSSNKQLTFFENGNNNLSKAQLANYIRPYNEIKNSVGETVLPGELQEYDLKEFEDAPLHVKNEVRHLAKSKPVILYEFRYWSGDKKIPIGWVITGDHNSNYKLLAEIPAKNKKRLRA